MVKKLQFDYYDEDEFTEFLDSLPVADAASFARLIQRVEEIGITTSAKADWIAPIHGKKYQGLFELRSKHGSNIQRALYFHKIGNHYLITNCFTKKSQKTPTKELNKALNRKKIYENNS
ncbi:type II toxin-antitoxin system RelE/ParE family toxin [Lactobacillus sp. ESL0681]|uniref:type II toxin-antitoxin system RelE/ParE family toxin n=1 Tax=Lactobacillus sp. ESL0681 TaxID=2983211 RepID=UPI0023F79924|nr:type II toxin-antitoxin system RelE/ParE family toxin [Lactobacillus sp. ESL0681]WEV41289.1 type II toxin-antitoxin system RelE/ParE family toxin [Lactobacillus sp. ESL0681]